MLRTPLIVLAVLLVTATTVDAQLRVRSLARIKGQEENQLHGFGLVVGLNGTGDGEIAPTQRNLALVVQQFIDGTVTPQELKDVKNVALVSITATVPFSGARKGDKLQCQVQAIGAKSLQGGVLFFGNMRGPDASDQTLVALASGRLRVDPKTPTNGIITRGCTMVEDFFNPFLKDGHLTLVIKDQHADFQMAQEIAEVINSLRDFANANGSSTRANVAKAVDAKNVVVKIPDGYLENPVEIISYILEAQLATSDTRARVRINRQKGSIIIDPGVVIRPVVIAHKELVISPDSNNAQIIGLEHDLPENRTTQLKALVDALKTLKVPSDVIIDIIEEINEMGALYGELIIN